jgi:anaerobic selenocysteine-containing dehydrogenase
MLLIGRRQLRSNNSWMHNIDVLMKGRHDCTLLIHPDDAAALGVDDGQQAKVASSAGKVIATAEVTEDMMPGVVSLPHGWGHDREGMAMSVAAAKPGVNSNILSDESELDALSGNAILNAIPVTVAAAS